MTNVAVVLGVAALGLLPAAAAHCAEAPEAVKRSVRVAVGAGYVASLDDLSDDSDAGVALAVEFATHPSPAWRLGASLGVDVEVADAHRVGVEGRAALAPFSGADCSAAYIPGEPPDPPEGFRRRLLLAVTFENPF
jgi:hypothetical protein